MDTSGESWGWLPPLLPLPLTDGGAKTKQPSRQSGFRPYEGKHPLHQKSNVVRDLFSRGPRLARSSARKAEAGNNAGGG